MCVAVLAVLTAVRPALAQLEVDDLTATPNGPSQIDLSWTQPSEAGVPLHGYEIEVSPSGAEGTWRTAVRNTGGTTYSHTGLTPETTRHYRISAFWYNDQRLTEITSNVASATTTAAATFAPNAPTNLTARANGPTQMDLSWTTPPGAVAAGVTGYKIEISPSGSHDAWTTRVTDTGSTATTYSHTGLTPRTTWHYRVSAVNASSAGSPSNVANATTTHRTATGAVRVEELARALKISWDAAQGSRVDGYCLEWRVGRINYEFYGCHPRDVIPPARRTYTITGLTPGTEYGVRVTGVGYVSSPDWPQVFGTPIDGKVSGMTAAATSGTSLRIGWIAVPGATGYTVQWRSVTGQNPDQNWSTQRQATATGNSHTITGLTSGTRYVVRVQAQLAGGATSPWSDNIFGTPPTDPALQAVTNLSVETVSATSFTAKWSAVSGADSYTVQWNNWRAGQRWDEAGQSASVSSTSHTFTVAASSKTWTWRVRVRPETSGGLAGPWAFAGAEQTALTGPTGLTATAKSSGEVDLAWTAPSVPNRTVSKYIVQWRTASNDDGGKIITDAAAEEAAVTGLRPDTTYRFYVKAEFTSTQESADATASATTHAVGGPPGKPTGLTARATSDTWIALTWKPATGQGVTSYAIETSPNGTDSWTSVNRDTGTTVPSYDHGGLEPETTYHYRVLARNSRGTSGWSDTASATTDEEAEGDSGPDSNRSPAFERAPTAQAATEGTAFSYTVPAATDYENDPIVYTAALSDGSALPEWLSFNAATLTFSGTPGANDAPAALDIEVTATDDRDPPLSRSATFTLTVEAAGVTGAVDPTPPTADAGADLEGKRGGAVTLSGSGTLNAQGSQDAPTYSWRIVGASHAELLAGTSWLSNATQATATYNVPRRKDMTDRKALDNGQSIDFQLTVTDGDGESATDTVTMTIEGSTWKVVHLSVADAEAQEDSGSIKFAVSLSAAARDPVLVEYATSDGTAVAGTDYTAASGTLTFQPGETQKTVTVPVLDDAHDEGTETFTLTLSNPTPAEWAKLADGAATGSIKNADPLMNAWLARFGRSVASQTVLAVSERLAMPAGAGSHVTLGGQRIWHDAAEGRKPDDGSGTQSAGFAGNGVLSGTAGWGSAEHLAGRDDGPDWLSGTADAFRSMAGREFLLGSHYEDSMRF